MLLAVRRRLATLKIEARLLRAGVTRTLFSAKVHHTGLSMLLAVRRGVASHKIEAGCLGAGSM